MRLLDVFFKQKAVYLVYEKHDADLNRTLEVGLPSPTQARVVMTHLIEALAHVHGRGRMHTDVQPGNILVDKKLVGGCSDGEIQWQCVLRDLGAVLEAASQQRVEGSEITTLWYRAPELIFGSRTFSYKIDMWSAGLVMLDLSGQTWHRLGKTPQDVAQGLASHLGTPSTPPSWVNAGTAVRRPPLTFTAGCIRQPWPAAVRLVRVCG